MSSGQFTCRKLLVAENAGSRSETRLANIGLQQNLQAPTVLFSIPMGSMLALSRIPAQMEMLLLAAPVLRKCVDGDVARISHARCDFQTISCIGNMTSEE